MIKRIALATPLKDEESFIGDMVHSILQQKIRPTLWVIVDDGSTDKTPQIIEEYCRSFNFMELVRLPPRLERKPGGEGAIGVALTRIDSTQFDYIARFDADLLFEPDYFARLLKEFESNPHLGIAGGCLYIEKDGQRVLEKAPEYHVRGALKMYRSECFAQLGGLATEIGWDTIDEVSAWVWGWETHSFPEIEVIHRRPTGLGIHETKAYRERGRAEYLTWSHPFFILLKAAKVALKNPSHGWNFVSGVLYSYLHRLPRLQSKEFRRVRRNQQMFRLYQACSPQAFKHRF